MDEDKLLKLTAEECFLLLTGARLFDRLVAGVTIHAEQKDELIRDIIAKLQELVPEQLESMSDELADAIVESVLGCEEIEESELEELELAFLDTEINDNWENNFFDDSDVRQLSIDGLAFEEEEVANTKEFAQTDNNWPPFELEATEEPYESIIKPSRKIQESNSIYGISGSKALENDELIPSSPKFNVSEQFEKYFQESTFSYPMYSVDDKLPIIEKALLKHKSIKTHYYSVARETVDNIRLDPLVLLQEDGIWLLVAHCHERDDILIFRVDRMKEIEETSSKFETPKDINELRCKMLAAYK